MKFDKETVIGLIFCFILMMAWPSISEFMGWTPPREEIAEVQTQEPSAADTAPESAVKGEAKSAGVVVAEKKAETAVKAESPAVPDEKFRNDALELTVSPTDGAIKNIRFLKYMHNDLSGEIAIDSRLFALDIPKAHTVAAHPVVDSDNTLVNTRTLTLPQGKLLLKQQFSLKNDYVISCRYTLTNIGTVPVTLDGMVVKGGSIAPWHTLTGDKLRTMSHRLDLLTADGDHEDIDADEDDEDYYFNKPPQVKWAAVSNKYFCSVLKSDTKDDFRLWQEDPRPAVTDAKGKEYNVLTIGAALPECKLLPGESESFDFSTYTGPKSSEALSNFVPSGEKVMHLAWGPLNYLARFLMWILNMLFALCHSYGVSIIILTLLVRTAFYPLTAKGNESMQKMRKVQPLFKELKEKYKDNPQLLNQKMTELYRKEGINPFAGCLPILLQIPIFFALYAMLDNAVALRHVSFLWAKNLAAADTVFSIPLGFTLPLANIDAIPVNPLVLMMTVLMVIQQRMTPMTMDPAQKKMMAMMPVIMLIFLYDLPSGLTLYWTISNLFSIIQLWLQNRRNRALLAEADKQSK
ncbi:MAG: membrane protein insertase YidC [Lentisphaerae bacterium]|nr:membrane protein insertase YidC [Lentisphaerota bacterium]